MKKRGLLLLICFFLLSGCGKNVIIDWVDFIKINDISYESHFSSLARELTEDDLDDKYSEIRFKVSDNVRSTKYKIKNGDAAFLDKGTVIYTVKGYDPSFRLAAKRNGKIILYQSYNNPNAKNGSDYLDIGGKVRYIGINSDYDGTTELAKIEDPNVVQQLVNILLTSPIVEPAKINYEGSRYMLVFYLNDGTTVEQMYWLDMNSVRDIIFSEEFQTIIQSALAK